MLKICKNKNRCKDNLGYKKKYSFKDSIIINAPVEKVWAVLTDIESFPDWNPNTIRLVGEQKVGAILQIETQLSKKRTIKEEMIVRAYEQNQRWCWGNKIFSKIFGYSQRCKIIRRFGKNQTLYITTEKFKGMLAPMIIGTMKKRLLKGFKKESLKLKRRVENL